MSLPIDAVFLMGAAGEGEKLLGQIARTHGRIFRVDQARGHFVVGRKKEGCERDVADDGSEKIIEVVRNAAGEKSKLFQCFGLAPFGFIALALGDVAKNQNDTDDIVLVVADRGSDLLDDVLGAVARSQGRVFGKTNQNRLRFVAIAAFLRARLRGQIDRDVEDGLKRLTNRIGRGPAG